jgi:release factor glutamine methyltransferase
MTSQILVDNHEHLQIIAHLTDKSWSDLRKIIIVSDDPFRDLGINQSKLEQINELIKQYYQKIPLQHLLGYANFYNIRLEVGQGVFIPRPETELLVETALKKLESSEEEQKSAPKIVDLCTGSGAIALAVFHNLEQCDVTAVELSKDALKYTRRNFKHFLAEQSSRKTLKLEEMDVIRWMKDQKAKGQKYDVVLSNPPYVPIAFETNGQLTPQVLQDPTDALFSGVDGLDLIRQMIANLPDLISENGIFIVEHFETGAEKIAQLLKNEGFTNVHTLRDLNDSLRFTVGQLAVL